MREQLTKQHQNQFSPAVNEPGLVRNDGLNSEMSPPDIRTTSQILPSDVNNKKCSNNAIPDAASLDDSLESCISHSLDNLDLDHLTNLINYEDSNGSGGRLSPTSLVDPDTADDNTIPDDITIDNTLLQNASFDFQTSALCTGNVLMPLNNG